MSQMIAERIKLLRERKGYNMRQMAKALNMPYTTYVNYEKGAREPNSEQLVLIAKYFEVSTDYLLGRTSDEIRNDSNEAMLKKFDNIRQISKRKIPVIGDIACGEPIFKEEVDTYVMASSSINADFALICKGDSMTGARIYDGDVVFIRSQSIVDNGEIAAVSIGEEATLKRVYYYPDKGKLVLCSENSKYEPFVYSNEELNNIRILGKAVAFMSNIK